MKTFMQFLSEEDDPSERRKAQVKNAKVKWLSNPENQQKHKDSAKAYYKRKRDRILTRKKFKRELLQPKIG